MIGHASLSVVVSDVFDETKKRKNSQNGDKFGNKTKKIPKIVLEKCDPSKYTGCSQVQGKQEPDDDGDTAIQVHAAQNPRHVKAENERLADETNNLERNSELESEEEEDSKMSAYERMRMKNIKDNAKFFASLDIFKAKQQFSAISETSSKKSTSTKTSPKEKKVLPPPRKPSLRLRRQDPDGNPLPPKPVVRYIDEITKRDERKPAGPLEMLPTNLSESSKENSSAKVSEMMKDITNSPNTLPKQSEPDLQSLYRAFAKMKITPERVAKVTRERVYSIAIHPSQDKVLVCAGDKGGRLGIWDMGSKNTENKGILVFEPHSSPVNCLHFAPANPGKIYSTSYDGTVRCGDFEKGVFDEVYATTLGLDIYISHFDFLSPDGSQMIVAQNDGEGHVAVVDTRTRDRNYYTVVYGACDTTFAHNIKTLSESFEGIYQIMQDNKGAESVYRLHNKSIRTVSVHPIKNNYIVTGSKDATVALWDTRCLKLRGKNKHIASLNHGRGVTSAYFSPLTGKKLLTTSYNDTLRVYTFSEDGAVFLKTSIRHNNYVGRWLTSFRAVWHPQREDMFVSGSMERPRRIEVFDDKGTLLKNFMDEECLGSVCSINAFHPTRNILVGGNSSGRLHVFM